MDQLLLLQSIHYILPITVAILGLSIYLFGFQSVKEPNYNYINFVSSTRKKKTVVLPKKQVPSLTSSLLSKNAPVATSQSPKHAPLKVEKIVKEKENKKVKKVVEEDGGDVDGGAWLPAPARSAAKNKTIKDKAIVKKQLMEENALTEKKKKGSQKPLFKSTVKPKEEVLKEVDLNENTVKKLESETLNAPKETKIPTPASKTKTTKEAPAPELIAKDIMSATTTDTIVNQDDADLWEESKSRGNKKKLRARRD